MNGKNLEVFNAYLQRHSDIDKEIKYYSNKRYETVLKELYNIFLTEQCPYTTTMLNDRLDNGSRLPCFTAPLTYYVYHMVLTNRSGGTIAKTIEELIWFTNLYENILRVYTNVLGDRSDGTDVYHIGWEIAIAPDGYWCKDRGNIVSSKNPAPYVKQPCYRDVNWFLGALGFDPFIYQGHDKLRETEGLPFQKLKEYAEIHKIPFERTLKAVMRDYEPETEIKIRFGDNVVTEFTNPKWSVSDASDNMCITIVQKLFPEHYPQPVIKWLPQTGMGPSPPPQRD